MRTRFHLPSASAAVLLAHAHSTLAFGRLGSLYRELPVDVARAAPPPVIVVDGTGLMFRSFFAMPPLTRASDGLPVGAVVGFCNSLVNLLLPYPGGPTPRVVVAFDTPGPTFRDELFDGYKAQRESPPEELGPQFPVAKEACAAFGWSTVSLDGVEADDVIASCAAQLAPRPVVIVGSDKDFLQLLDHRVVMMDPVKKAVFTPVDVEAKYGVPPTRMADLQALAGDATDNVPGVRGIGPKIAAQLLLEWGNLDRVLDNAAQVKQPKRRESLLEHRDAALLSRELVTLKRDVVLPDDLDFHSDAPRVEVDRVLDFCEHYALYQLASNIRRLSGQDGP